MMLLERVALHQKFVELEHSQPNLQNRMIFNPADFVASPPLTIYIFILEKSCTHFHVNYGRYQSMLLQL